MLTYCSLMILIIVLVSILKNVRELINLINKWVIVIYKHMRLVSSTYLISFTLTTKYEII